MKIQTSLTHRCNKTVSFPEVGEVSFDNSGQAEVTKEEFEILSGFDASITEAMEIIEKTKKAQEHQTNAEESGKGDEHKEVTLADMTVKQLQEIAKEANLEETEWKKLKKDDLIVYLESKIS